MIHQRPASVRIEAASVDGRKPDRSAVDIGAIVPVGTGGSAR
jgi:hypothetical protein